MNERVQAVWRVSDMIPNEIMRRVDTTIPIHREMFDKYAGEKKSTADFQTASLPHQTKVTKVLETSRMEIYFCKTPHIIFSFHVVPKNVKNIDEALFLLQLEEFIHLLKCKGYGQYVLCQNLGDKSVTIIPAPEKNGMQADINQKIINALFCFFGEEALSKFNSFPNKNLALTYNLIPSLRFPKKETIWMHAQTLARGVCDTLSSIPDVVPDFDMPLESIVNSVPLQISRPSLCICAFCTPTVIRNQLVIEFSNLLLLLNFKPWAGTRAHFLILPTRHIEDWSDLNVEERQTLSLVTNSLMNTIHSNCKANPGLIISYVQNGYEVGQTISHSHMHVVTRPEFTPYLVSIASEISGQQIPALSPKQMGEIAAYFKPALFQALSFNSPPSKPVDTPKPSKMMLYAYLTSALKRSEPDKAQQPPPKKNSKEAANLMMLYAYLTSTLKDRNLIRSPATTSKKRPEKKQPG